MQTHSKCGLQIKFSFLSLTFSICLSYPEHSDHLPPMCISNQEYCNLFPWPDCKCWPNSHTRVRPSLRPLLFPSLVVWQSSPTYSPLSLKGQRRQRRRQGRRRRQRPSGRRCPPRQPSLVWYLDAEKQIKETKSKMGRNSIKNLHKLLSAWWKTYSNCTPETKPRIITALLLNPVSV